MNFIMIVKQGASCFTELFTPKLSEQMDNYSVSGRWGGSKIFFKNVFYLLIQHENKSKWQKKVGACNQHEGDAMYG